ncbi:PREDICTED: endogenous retrovirus group K member 18 Pol protein-like [Tinamus guttatus]|uniref:endogenous retrovirus group K member 18 Pol protein-like n=1 Tax=Tinamus guttatus TaxID=94827 RepID=UPI00052F40F8|nr:PREDICTED: endogenous retrovirus group K member 18 Pol protein-like [Tinamus guttatus]
MADMGALQPGLPSLNMIPANWTILIIDLKDCFFTILLHPYGYQKFAFSVPSVNKQAPMKRYHWVVLPQGMKNSPTMYVAWALAPVRQAHPKLVIYHHMDYILISREKLQLDTLMTEIEETLKIQTRPAWKYLGWEITKTTVRPQKIEIKFDIKTLNDIQKVLGDLNWVRAICGFTNSELAPLMILLKGGEGVRMHLEH